MYNPSGILHDSAEVQAARGRNSYAVAWSKCELVGFYTAGKRASNIYRIPIRTP